ncbi:MAG: hypothetical protein PHI18_08315, partial [bacterium]|nr:hypothetical protein [bacterium]
MGLMLRIVFIVWTPVGEISVPGRLSSYNDELAHANYIHHLVHHQQLPSFVESIQEPGALERAEYEFYQPALYYLLVAGLAELLGYRDLPEIIFLGRALGSVLSIGLLLTFAMLCRSLRLTAPATGSGLMFIALSGVFVRFTSMVNNDALFWLLVGGLFISLLRLRENPMSVRHLVLFIVLAVAALYTKLTSLLVLPLLITALPRHHSRLWLLRMIGAFGLIFLATLPIWQRNVLTFGAWLPLVAGFGSVEWHVPCFGFLSYAARSFFFPWSELWQGVVGLLVLLIPAAFFAVRIAAGRSWDLLLTNRILGWSVLLSLCAFL